MRGWYPCSAIPGVCKQGDMSAEWRTLEMWKALVKSCEHADVEIYLISPVDQPAVKW
jgi:hypothetical protein